MCPHRETSQQEIKGGLIFPEDAGTVCHMLTERLWLLCDGKTQHATQPGLASRLLSPIACEILVLEVESQDPKLCQGYSPPTRGIPPDSSKARPGATW